MVCFNFQEIIENNGNTWRCRLCEKTFTTKGSAKRHLVSHSAESKPFECSLCPSKFARRDDLYTHLRRKHAAHQLVETMMEEHKSELRRKLEGVVDGKSQLLNLLSHDEHLDLVLPSGTTICRPMTSSSSSSSSSTTNTTTPTTTPEVSNSRTNDSSQSFRRVIHDDHEDFLINGALHHQNDAGEWEHHGELGGLEDLEFLLFTAQDNNSTSELLSSSTSPDFSLEDINIFMANNDPQKRSLLLPGGSVFCRTISQTTKSDLPQVGLVDHHKHSIGCGHRRIKHDNHFDFLVGNTIVSEKEPCIMHGSAMLEKKDAATVSLAVSALTEKQRSAAAAANNQDK